MSLLNVSISKISSNLNFDNAIIKWFPFCTSRLESDCYSTFPSHISHLDSELTLKRDQYFSLCSELITSIDKTETKELLSSETKVIKSCRNAEPYLYDIRKGVLLQVVVQIDEVNFSLQHHLQSVKHINYIL